MENFNIENIMSYIDGILDEYSEIDLTLTIHTKKLCCKRVIREEIYNLDKRFVDFILNRKSGKKYSYVHYNYSFQVDEKIIDNIIEFYKILNNYTEYKKKSLFIKYVSEDKGYLYFTYNKKVYKLSYSYGISISKHSIENAKHDKIHSFKFEDLKEFSEKQIETNPIINNNNDRAYSKKKHVKNSKIS